MKTIKIPLILILSIILVSGCYYPEIQTNTNYYQQPAIQQQVMRDPYSLIPYNIYGSYWFWFPAYSNHFTIISNN